MEFGDNLDQIATDLGREMSLNFLENPRNIFYRVDCAFILDFLKGLRYYVPSKMSILTLKIDQLYPQNFYPHESSLFTLKKCKMYPHYPIPSKNSICTLKK